tara:strand:+ start:86 stop:337 length:252 start_codon:yes stop_codon:yes gene_type:complete
MPKSKEFSKPHAAMQTEETPSIVSQIPKEHMGAAIDKLIDMAIANKAKKEAANRGTMHPDNVEFFRNLMTEAKAKGPVPPKAK